MIAQAYEKEIRTICLLAVGACRLPVAGMAALAKRPVRPAAPPAEHDEDLAELVRRLRENFVYDPSLDPDAEEW